MLFHVFYQSIKKCFYVFFIPKPMFNTTTNKTSTQKIKHIIDRNLLLLIYKINAINEREGNIHSGRYA